MELEREGYVLSDDRSLLDVPQIYRWLSEDSYWAKGRPYDVAVRSIDESECVGVYAESDGSQVAFARLVTDRSTFAWLCDVYVAPEHRGRGLGHWLVRACIEDEDLLGTVSRVLLATHDAHQVYADIGFVPLTEPERWMELRREM